MKKTISIFVAIILFAIPSFASAKSIPETNSQLEQSLNHFAKTNKEADFDSATVKGKTITLKVDDDYIESPVHNSGRVSFLNHLYKQINKIQKQNKTKYSVVIKDDWTGKFAKMDYKGKGWYTTDSIDNSKEEYNFAKLDESSRR